MEGKDWKFICMSFQEAFKMMKENDFVYLDPPYIDRYDGYYDTWCQEYADLLAELTQNGKVGYAFSMWYKNEYRTNSHLKKWNKGVMLTTEHFYHIGAKEKNRNQMIEALVVSKDNVSMYKS